MLSPEYQTRVAVNPDCREEILFEWPVVVLTVSADWGARQVYLLACTQAA
jgi:hypothetical protein